MHLLPLPWSLVVIAVSCSVTIVSLAIAVKWSHAIVFFVVVAMFEATVHLGLCFTRH